MSVEFVTADILHMDEATFMWVQQTHFTFDVTQDDRDVLRELITCDAYAHDYASPFSSHPEPSRDRIHGRWRLDALNADRFRPIESDDAISTIDKWATEQDWVDSSYRPPEHVMARLEPVYELLRSGTVFHLDNPGEDAMHDYGFVTGNMGFHEFVVVDRTTGALHVVVASDD